MESEKILYIDVCSTGLSFNAACTLATDDECAYLRLKDWLPNTYMQVRENNRRIEVRNVTFYPITCEITECTEWTNSVNINDVLSNGWWYAKAVMA